MRQAVEYFDDREPVLIYIASSLRKALKLEKLLTDNNVEYYVETDQYVSGFLIPTAKTGAFFYVAEERADEARELMRRNRFRAHQ